jgi:nicotinate-nucleotide adenylyltransferase
LTTAHPPSGVQRHYAARRPRNIALFGGSFDPIHVGHLAVARAAQRRFHLDEVHFIPSGRPPHKHAYALAPYPHRFAMVALACSEHPAFVPSLAEAGTDQGGHEKFYSIDTVRHFKARLRRSVDHLYFILGADSFLEIPTWKDYEALLLSCDFVVASRPGFRLNALRLVIPPELFARPHPGGSHPDPHAIELRRSIVYVMDTVDSSVSATEVRKRLARKQLIHGLVPARVEEYICKQNLYRHQ